MSEQATKLIESAQAGTLPAVLIRDMIYQGKMPHDHVIEGSNPYKDGMAQAEKDREAGKNLKAELEKLRKADNPDYSFLGGYEKVIKQQKGVRINWPANPGYLYKTSAGYKFERDKGHAAEYRGPHAREQMRNALKNTFNIPSKDVDAAIQKVDTMKESLNESLVEESIGDSTLRRAKVFLEQFARDMPAGKYSEKDLKAKGYDLLRKSPESYNVMKDGKQVGIVYKSAPGWICKDKAETYSAQEKSPIDAVMKCFRLTSNGGPMRVGKESVNEATFKVMGKSSAGTEELDTFDTKEEAEKMAAEYRMAYGKGWTIWVTGGNGKRESVREGFESDETVAYELSTLIDNDATLYRQMKLPIIRNMATKKAQGSYNAALAVKAFMYLVDEGAKRYAQAHGGPGAKWHEMFPKNIRTLVAKNLVDEFEAEFDLGNYNNLLPKKYQSKMAEDEEFIARAASFLEKCKSKGKKLMRESELVECVELNEGEAAFVLETPEHMTQLEELLANLTAAQVPFSLDDDEETGEIILSWGEGWGNHVESAMEALGITTYDDEDLTPEAGVDYLPYQHGPGVSYTAEDDAMETAQTISGKPKGDLPSLFKPVGEEPKKKEDDKKKKNGGLLSKLSQMIQRAHGSGNTPMTPTATPIPASENRLTAADLIELRLRGGDVDELISGVAEVSDAELLARFGDKRAKPFKDDKDKKNGNGKNGNGGKKEESVPGEDKAWNAGVEFGKKNKLSDVKDTEEMYQACLKAGVSSSLFDIFKYGAQSAWRESGQLK